MRRREVSSSFWKDERVWALSDAARLLYIGLMQLADREGRQPDQPFNIGVEARPWAPREAAALIDEIVSTGLVTRYVVGEVRVLAFPAAAWKRHQRPHPNERASVLPANPLETQAADGTPSGVPRLDVGSTKVLLASAGSSGSSEPSGPSGSSGSERSLFPAELLTPVPEAPRRKRKASRTTVDAAPDPRHTPLVSDFVEAFKATRNAPYPFGGRDAKAVAELLATNVAPADLVAAWRRALVANWPKTSTLWEFRQNLAHFIGAGPKGDLTKGDWRANVDHAKSWGVE